MKDVELSRISKSYDAQTEVLSDISVSIQAGEFFVLVGPSGCGKSTMLRMIAGLEDITEGTLIMGQKKVNDLPPSKRNLSMVFQNYALYPHLSVEENIVFGLRVKKVSKIQRKKRCHRVANMLGLSDYLNRKPRQLSGGQRQRVALARAIVNESPLCLMDEPLSNLDAKLRAQMRSEIKQIQRQLNITMIYVTHDQVEAMTMGDRIMILNEGKIQQVGDPIDVYNAPANEFVAKFIGSPPMNLAKATYYPDKQSLSVVGRMNIKLSSEDIQVIGNKQVSVGVRPEHLQVATNESQQSGSCIFEVKVNHVEVLGNETLLNFEFAGGNWQAKWNGQWRVRVGDIIPLSVSYSAVCLFDSETGRMIRPPTQQDQHLIQGVPI